MATGTNPLHFKAEACLKRAIRNFGIMKKHYRPEELKDFWKKCYSAARDNWAMAFTTENPD